MPDFSGLVFPEDISYGSQGGPRYSTSIVIRKSGRETRNANWDDPLLMFDAAYGVKTQAQMNALISFFQFHQGRAVSFLFKDYGDSTVPTLDAAGATASDGILGTTGLGDGATTAFQMYKRYVVAASTKRRKISRPKSGAVTIWKDGVQQSSGFTIDYATGIVTFSAAPANGAVITWRGDFYFRARFDTDELPVQFDTYNNHSASVPIVQDRE